MDNQKTPKQTAQEVKDALDYAGVATDIADDDKVDNCLVKQETRELNNNPNNDL